MRCVIRIRKWLVAGLMVLPLTACGEDDGVDGTGVESDDLMLFQACFAQAPAGECAAADFNGDGFINYIDMGLMKSAKQFDLNGDGFVDTRQANDNADLSELNACLNSNTQECGDADFNHDSVVNEEDVALFQTAAQFDLNGDESVDLRDISNIVVEYSEDLAVLLDCLYDAPVNECANSDLNGDQVIDFNDTAAFTAASRYDLNGDGIIDFTNDANNVLSNVMVNEDLKVIRDCFLKSTLDAPECVIADFNGDSLVNVADLAEFKLAEKFDLNFDGFVDLRTTIESQDIWFISSCFYQTANGNCAKADFNADGIVNVLDLAEFKTSGRYDLNGDDVVDLNDSNVNADLAILKSCFFATSGDCMAADFNEDGVVNGLDLVLFNSANKYDLNLDGYVDLRLAVDALAPQELAIIKQCFFNAADGDCAKADFNADGFVNSADLAEFLDSVRFDLNGDDVIDLHDTDTNADLQVITDCFLSSNEECMIADFNDDGIVNVADLALFLSAAKYDLNADEFVDLRVVADAFANQDLAVIKLCFFSVAEGECAIADFNDDGIVNVFDLAEFKLSGRFDLNGDDVVDLHDANTNADLAMLKSCFFATSGSCLDADFNQDGIVNVIDLGMFKAAEKYDLNGDQIVDLRP